MTDRNNKCVKVQLLGEVSAIITGKYPPKRHNVLWAYPTGTDKYSLRRWDGTEWVELVSGFSGNYDTVLDDNIEMPFSVGGLPAGTTVGDLKGDPLISLWDRLLFPPVGAVYFPPTAYISGNDPKLFRVGSPASPSILCSFDPGDAGALQGFSLFRNGTVISNIDSYTDAGVVLSSPGTMVYKGEYSYADGPILDDNYGNPSPAGRILAGSISTSNVSYKWVYPVLYGGSTQNTGINLNSGEELLQETIDTIQLNLPSVGPKYYWVAVPASTVYTHWYITDLNQGDIGAGEGWASPVPITLNYAGITGVPYLLYVTNFITQFSAPITFL